MSTQVSGQATTANSLKISPLRTEIRADPGETKIVKIVVTNTTDQDISVRPIQNDFTAGDEDGSPAIILDETEFAPQHSLKRFMRPLDSFIVPASQSVVSEAVIDIPESAEAGGYFGSMRFAPTTPGDGGQVNMSISVASLILLTVNGDAPEKMTITDFSVSQNDRPGSLFFETEGVELNMRFQNSGKVHLSPFGKISIIKGDEVIYDWNFNDKEQPDNVLPGSARRWSLPLEGIESFGQYTIKATLTYGSQNKTIEMTRTFWVVPLPIAIAIAGALLLIIGGLVGAVIYRRRRKSGLSFRIN